MRIGKYTFQCRFKSLASLPEFKGSTLRGGFGHALKRISCALRRQDCSTCLLFETCAYAFLFEVKKALPYESKCLRVAQRPHPYVIVPPDDTKRAYEADDPFSFDFILFGRANDYLPHILYAVREMGQNGIGKTTKCEGLFEIEKVLQGDQTIFTGDILDTNSPLQQVSLNMLSASDPDKITFHCQTPLRLKYINELQASLPFHLVIRAALRRVSMLETVYGNGAPDLDFKGIAARATSIKTTDSDCRWIEIERYSNRQRSAMKFGGVLGSLVYKGEGLAEFLPLLHYCEVTHLGKQTSFGLGKIVVQDKTEA